MEYYTDEELEQMYGLTRNELHEDMTVRDSRDLVLCEIAS